MLASNTVFLPSFVTLCDERVTVIIEDILRRYFLGRRDPCKPHAWILYIDFPVVCWVRKIFYSLEL